MEAKTKSISHKRLLCCFAAVLLCCFNIAGVEGKSALGPEQYKVFALENISGQEGAKLLTQAKIGTVSQLPGSNTLLITAQPSELRKASAILELVDSKEKYVIKALLPASQAKNLPTNDRIAATLGNILIGTFSRPPVGTGKVKAIIDVHGNSVVAIAPASWMGAISSAIERLGKSQPEAEKAAVAAEPSEQVILQPERQTSQPTESSAVVVIEKPSEDAEPTTTIRRSYEPEPIADGNEELEVTLLPEKLTVIELLDLVGKYLNLDYMYDEQDLIGQDVSLRVQGPIKVNELYPLLESVMKFKGFVMTRKLNLITIRPMNRVLEIDPVLLDEQKGEVKAGDVIVTRIFRLKHIDTASAQNFLTGMDLAVKVSPVEATNTLIVTDYAYRMGRIEELLAMVDRPGEPKQFRYRQLRYTMAKTLAPKVKTLAEELGTVSITISATTAAAAVPPSRPRQPGETEAAYRARVRRETEARRRAAAQPAAATPVAGKPTVYLEADERTNRILMIGLEEQLSIVDKLIDTLDVEQQDLRILQLYEIRHVGADEVVEKLGELGIISRGAVRSTTQRTGRITTTPARTPTPPTGRTPPTGSSAATEAAGESPLVEEPQVVILEGRNALLVNATPEQHAQIAMIIGYVDTQPEEAAINYVVYPLENQDPEELAGVLNQLIQETITERSQDDKVVRTTTTSKIEEDITIIADPKTYSLIVYASKKNQQWIGSLIEQLDEYRPQVLLDVTLVEVTKNDEFSYDIDLLSKFPKLAGGGTMESSGLVNALLSPFPTKRVAEARSTAGAGGTGFYADEHIQLLLNAMQTKNYGRVLARPKLLVNDNWEGTIKAEKKKTIVSPKTQIIPGSASGSQPTAATSVEFATYTEGITLVITPHISKGDQLQLTITLTRIDFDEQLDYKITGPDVDLTGPTPPDLLTSDITTVVTVPNNHTIILGGLEKLNQSKGGTKVPILGDIPIVGGVFRNTDNKDDQSRLYVFVKAHILRPGEAITAESDVVRVSRENREKFEKYEREMQEYEDWPGIKPAAMDPLRILEED